MVEPKMGFQTDAFNGLSYWLAFAWPRFDWLTAPTINHHFETPPKLSALLSLVGIPYACLMKEKLGHF